MIEVANSIIKSNKTDKIKVLLRSLDIKRVRVGQFHTHSKQMLHSARLWAKQEGMGGFVL